MAVVDSIPAWLSASGGPAVGGPAAGGRAGSGAVAPADSAFDDSVAASPTSGECSGSCLAGSSSNPNSQIQNPKSESLFPDPLTEILLSEIAAGFQSLSAIAAAHHIPYPKFTLWLLQPATQQKLSELSTAIAAAARLTATAALPDIVRGLKSTLEQLNSHTFVPVALPGADPLRAQALSLRRYRAAISASELLYRISRFTCPSPHPRLPHPTSPKGEVRPKAVDGARSPGPDGGAVERSETEGAPEFSAFSPRSSLPTSDLSTGTPARAPNSPSSSPNPKSQIQNPTSPPPMPIDEATQSLIEDRRLTDEQTADLRASSRACLPEHLHKLTDTPFIFDDEIVNIDREVAATSSADDG
jgi:hypothetical protein